MFLLMILAAMIGRDALPVDHANLQSLYPCQWTSGEIVPYINSAQHGECFDCSHRDRYLFYYSHPDQKDEFGAPLVVWRMIMLPYFKVFLDDDHDHPINWKECLISGRPVEFCFRHLDEIRLTGGIRPQAFHRAILAEIVHSALSHPRYATERYSDRMVRLGLGSNCYATREAAERILIAHGAGSLGGLFRGLLSRDPEIRYRSGLIIRRIRYGHLENE